MGELLLQSGSSQIDTIWCTGLTKRSLLYLPLHPSLLKSPSPLPLISFPATKISRSFYFRRHQNHAKRYLIHLLYRLHPSRPPHCSSPFLPGLIWLMPGWQWVPADGRTGGRAEIARDHDISTIRTCVYACYHLCSICFQWIALDDSIAPPPLVMYVCELVFLFLGVHYYLSSCLLSKTLLSIINFIPQYLRAQENDR